MCRQDTIARLLPAALAGLLLAAITGWGIVPAAAGQTAGPAPLAADRIPEDFILKGTSVALNIPARMQCPTRPCKEGWCGETALQEILLFHGAYFTQADINKAGKPKHPDLYSDEIPVALAGLHVGCEVWPQDIKEVPVLLNWIRYHVRLGIPVLVGVKINPTSHPEWGLDHFCAAVGFDGDSFVFNTTGGDRETRSAKQLASEGKGYSFKNRWSTYYALAVTGRPAGEGAVPVRAFVVRETGKTVGLVVKCEGLTPGAEYVVYKSRSWEDEPKPFAAFKATGSVYGFSDATPADHSAVYRCLAKGVLPAKAAKSGPAGLSTQVQGKLRTPITFTFNKNDLADVVQFFGEVVSGVKLEADWEALERQGIRRTAPVSLKLNGMSLNAAIWRVLLGVDANGIGRLGYVVRDGRLVVTAAPDPGNQPAGGPVR